LERLCSALAIDFSKPHFSVFLVHDAQGKASIPLDLRGFPVTLRGLHFGMQTFAVSTALQPVLSTPWIGVLH
jgi:hypothetical protein